jgi:DNA modification methylase
MKNKRNVWTVTTKPFKDAHFATYPKDLIEPCIKAGCPEGGTVLDPFGGSGTTGIVAQLNNRNSILIELNPEYIKIAKNRIYKELGIFNNEN